MSVAEAETFIRGKLLTLPDWEDAVILLDMLIDRLQEAEAERSELAGLLLVTRRDLEEVNLNYAKVQAANVRLARRLMRVINVLKDAP